ncbi:MAG: DUF2207 domain-containing protein [Methanobrevibacter sp.]|uniref:DUF2207 domain-containing protein n=1 Tax=Methanobrevibacter sp. TaxID=66852 RepID=UPI0025FCA197|nr:DUF2207 domain-containing protein [Methanobrevibacter sp.]MBQ6100185.1 DUF2207 domain-containing protein [Methanobrevibacter sp.]
MNIKRALCIVLLFLLLFSTVSMAFADDDRSYSITQAFIDLTVESNGLLHVEEQYDYSFDGKFNGVYRDIPLKSGESIDNIQVSAIGAYPVLKQSDDGGYKHLKIYLYSDAAHTKGIRDCDVSVFISYDMKNVVTLFNDVGALQYKLWGEEWDVGVGKITATVKLPGEDENTYYLNPEDYDKSSSLNGDTITAETTSIPKGELYELLVMMPLDDFSDATNAKHVNENGKDMIIKNHEDSINGRNFWNATYLILGLLSVLSPIGAIFTYFKWGREPKVSYDGIYERDLPTDDPPEVINALVENKSNIGTPNMEGFEASIMNLINKKVLKLSTRENSDTMTNDLIIKFNEDENIKVSRSEKIVLKTLSRFAQDSVLNLSELESKLSSESDAKWFMEQYEKWEESVKKKIDLAYYFDDAGSTAISFIAIGGIIFGIIIAVLGFLTNLSNGFYSLVGGIFLIVFSVALLFLDEDIFGRWTENGRVFYLKWNNLRKFLEDNSLINEHPPESIVVWNKYLVYGTALGVADSVYEAMKLQVPNISEYDDSVFMYHHYGGYYMMHHAFSTGQSAANPSSDSGSFGGFGGGSGGGGGGAF